MSIQQARLPSPPCGIAVAESHCVLSEVNTPTCIAAVWQRQPLPSFQTWLDALSAKSLPRARLILRAETVNDAMAHVCQQSGIPDCRERSMLTGDIAALAHIFAEISLCDYLRLRLTVSQDHQNGTEDDAEEGTRLTCVYRGPRLELCQSATGRASAVSVSNGVPFITRERDQRDLRVQSASDFTLPSDRAPLTSLVLTLDPVSDTGRSAAPELQNYH